MSTHDEVRDAIGRICDMTEGDVDEDEVRTINALANKAYAALLRDEPGREALEAAFREGCDMADAYDTHDEAWKYSDTRRALERPAPERRDPWHTAPMSVDETRYKECAGVHEWSDPIAARRNCSFCLHCGIWTDRPVAERRDEPAIRFHGAEVTYYLPGEREVTYSDDSFAEEREKREIPGGVEVRYVYGKGEDAVEVTVTVRRAERRPESTDPS